MSKEDELEGCVPVGDEVEVGPCIAEWVNEDALVIWLKVVGEYGELGCFELGNIVVLASLLSGNQIFAIHLVDEYANIMISR